MTNSSYSQQSTLGETSNGFSHRWPSWQPQVYSLLKTSLRILRPPPTLCLSFFQGLSLASSPCLGWAWVGLEWAGLSRLKAWGPVQHITIYESLYALWAAMIFMADLWLYYILWLESRFFWCTLNQRCSLIVSCTPLLSILQPNSQAVVDCVLLPPCLNEAVGALLNPIIKQVHHLLPFSLSQFLHCTLPCHCTLCPQFIFVLVIYFVLIQLSSSDYNSLTLSPCLLSWSLVHHFKYISKTWVC